MVRLPNGNVLVGYLRSEGPSPLPGDTTTPGGHGGIVELTPEGETVRAASAADAAFTVPIRPYSFAVRPEIDRMLMTSALMMEDTSADVIQIWKLSDLQRLATIAVSPARLPSGRVLPEAHGLPFEPRVMADGSDRLIVGAENGGENRMLMARVSRVTGALSWDSTFSGSDRQLGVSFRRLQWPHGASGEAFGHAALFRP